MNRLRNMMSRLAVFRLGDLSVPRREEGQTLVEYALILVLIAIVVIVVLTLLGGKISSVFGNVNDQL
jgi:pilus assembly protein Flp/PilA